MAITSGTANVHILTESAQHATVRCLYYTSNGTDESDVLKVNTATLTHKTVALTTANRTGIFQPGDTVTCASSGKTAQIVEWRRSANTIVVTNASGSFTDGENLTTTITNSTAALASSNASLNLVRELAIRSIWYSIDPDMTVELAFKGGNLDAGSSQPIIPAVLLSGSGYFGKNALAGQIISNAQGIGTSADGSFYISTYTTSSAKAAYTVIVDLVKLRGYAPSGL